MAAKVKIVRAVYGPKMKVYEVGSTQTVSDDFATELINGGKAVPATETDQKEAQAVVNDEKTAQEREDARAKKG